MGSYRGEGGVVWDLDEPLNEHMAAQVRTGRLVPIPSGAGETRMPVAATRPAESDPKSAWVEWAIANGWSRAAASRATLAELRAIGSEHEEAAGG